MTDLALMPDWSALFIGLFALFAGIGELRRPGQWQRLMGEITASPAFQVTMALVEFLIGWIIYIACPWSSPDWLSRVMKVIGAMMGVEAMLILGFADIYLGVLAHRLGPLSRIWAWITVVLGVVLIVLGRRVFMPA